MKFLEASELVADVQNGFRRECSCLHHIYSLTTIVRNHKNCNLSTYAAFVDFRKAFDATDRELLQCTLFNLGINGAVLELVKQMYLDTFNVLRINRKYSEQFESKIGVLQGNNLSPTCFNLYLNGLLCDLEKLKIGIRIGKTVVNCLAYADDIVLFDTCDVFVM